MASELPPGDAGTLVSLLLVVVGLLATLVRDIDEEPPDYVEAHPLLHPLRDVDETGDIPDIFRVPRLGRLNVLHTTNMAMLAAAFLILAAAEPGIVTNVFAVVVVIIWLQLPLIEVPNYQAIRGEGKRPWALYLHFLGTGLVIAYMVGAGGFEPTLFLREMDIFNPNLEVIRRNPAHARASTLLVVLLMMSSFAFLKKFEREIMDGDESGSDESPASEA